MINLIPPHAQKDVKREYWIRVVSVWLMLLGSACVIVTILNAPVFVLVQSQVEAFSDQYQQASAESGTFEIAQEKIKHANEIAQLLARSKKTTQFTSLLAELERQSGSDVSITDFTFNQKAGKLGPITISGKATSRLALTNFQSGAEEHPLFKSVELPLSNLAQDRDISFSITLELETAQE